MVQLENGTILMAMRNGQTDLTWFSLPSVKSTDDGYTWSYISQLDTNHHSAGRYKRGLRKPFRYVLPKAERARAEGKRSC